MWRAISVRRIQPAKLSFWPSSNLRGEDPPQLLIALRAQSEIYPVSVSAERRLTTCEGFPFLISFIENSDAWTWLKQRGGNSPEKHSFWFVRNFTVLRWSRPLRITLEFMEKYYNDVSRNLISNDFLNERLATVVATPQQKKIWLPCSHRVKM